VLNYVLALWALQGDKSTHVDIGGELSLCVVHC